jgi:hypothetical protein
VVPTAGEEQESQAGNAQEGAGRGPGGGTGFSGGTTSFFQIPADGKTIVYVLDRSSSMGLNGLLTTAKEELLRSLERLPPTVRFQVIIYNRTAQPLRIQGRTGLAPATADSKRDAAAYLKELFAEGSSEHVRALKQALLWEPDVIFFLTDAESTNAEAMSAEQVRAITALNHRSVIHAIELSAFPHADAESPLQLLARNNRGTYRSLVLSP